MKKFKLISGSVDSFNLMMNDLVNEGFIPFGNLNSTTQIFYDHLGKPTNEYIVLSQIFVKEEIK